MLLLGLTLFFGVISILFAYDWYESKRCIILGHVWNEIDDDNALICGHCGQAFEGIDNDN